MKYIFLLLPFVVQTAFAEIQIQQLIPSLDRAVIKMNGQTVAQDDLFLATDNGQQCPLRIFSIKKDVVILDTSTCEFKRQLKIGQTVERSLYNPAELTTPEPAVETRTNNTVSQSGNAISIKAPEQKPTYGACTNSTRDLSYIPCESQVILFPELSYSNNESTRRFTDGDNSKSEINNTLLEMTARYGFTNTLSAAVSVNNALDSERTNTSTGGRYSMEYEGTSNPIFYLGNRFLSESQYAPINLDVTLAYMPDMIDAKIPGFKTQAGTRGTGAEQYSASIYGTKRFGKLQLGLGFTHWKESSGSYKDLSEQQVYNFNSTKSQTYKADGMFALNQKIDLSAGLRLTDFDNDGAFYDTTTISQRIGLGYHINQNTSFNTAASYSTKHYNDSAASGIEEREAKSYSLSTALEFRL